MAAEAFCHNDLTFRTRYRLPDCFIRSGLIPASQNKGSGSIPYEFNMLYNISEMRAYFVAGIDLFLSYICSLFDDLRI